LVGFVVRCRLEFVVRGLSVTFPALIRFSGMIAGGAFAVLLVFVFPAEE
jgi:hypothetical protein